MSNPRICPHCHEDIPTDRGFSFDEKLNLICGKCGGIAFPTTEEVEISLSLSDQKQQPLSKKMCPAPEEG